MAGDGYKIQNRVINVNAIKIIKSMRIRYKIGICNRRNGYGGVEEKGGGGSGG